MSIGIFLTFCLFFVYSSQTDYCKLSCNHNGDHTTCIRKKYNCNAGPTCGNHFSVRNLSNRDRNLFINTHNSLRNKVALGHEKRGGGQPTAANMHALYYNKELETIAQCWTNNCKFEHDTCRRTEKYEHVGQNLAQYQTTADVTKLNISKIFENMVLGWYDEVVHFSPKHVSNYATVSGPATGHYTQLAWAEVFEVGCAVTIFQQGKWNTVFLACNYAPAGNWIGSPMYKVGKPGSACKKGIYKNYLGLCK